MKKIKIAPGMINNLLGLDATGKPVYQNLSGTTAKSQNEGDLNLITAVGTYTIGLNVTNKPAGYPDYIYVRVSNFGSHQMQEAWDYWTSAYIGYRTKGYPSATTWNAWRKS